MEYPRIFEPDIVSIGVRVGTTRNQLTLAVIPRTKQASVTSGQTQMSSRTILPVPAWERLG